MSRRLNLDTDVGGGQRYSFLETPLEMHAAGHLENQQPPLPVESHTYETQRQAVSDNAQPTSTTTQEKVQRLPEKSAASAYPSCPPPGEHPANYAPFADGIVLEKQNPEPPVPQYAYDAPPNSPGPLPVKADPGAVDEAQKSHPFAIVPDMNPLQSPQLPRSPPPVTITTTQSATPNNIIAYHQPGQISHPNQEINGGTWNHELCDCSNIGTCCLGLVCPCVLYGRTQYRLSMKSRKEDPTNLLGFEICNGSCMAMALFCGCQWLMATVQHTRTRKTYGIRGDIGSDCVRATCCTCCILIQDEKEIQKREGQRGLAAGAALTTPYMTPGPMSYPPPPTQVPGK